MLFPVFPSKRLQQEMWSFCDEGKNFFIFVGLIDNKLINFIGIMLAMLRLSVMSPLIYFKITGTF